MNVRCGHFVVLSLIVALATINVWLVSRSARTVPSVPDIEIPEPLQMATFTKLPVERPSSPKKYNTICRSDPNWNPAPIDISMLVEKWTADLSLREHPAPAEADLALEPASPGREFKIVLPRRTISGVEPMPFGGSMFGPWDVGRNSSATGP